MKHSRSQARALHARAVVDVSPKSVVVGAGAPTSSDDGEKKQASSLILKKDSRISNSG